MSEEKSSKKTHKNRTANAETKRVTLGQVVATPGALAALEAAGPTPLPYLALHARGDWGEALCAQDTLANDQALRHGERLLSAYFLPLTGQKLWIITEWDRSATTLLLPDEY